MKNKDNKNITTTETETTFIKWVDKYHPKTIDEMVLSEDLKTYFKNMISSGKFMNMTLCSSPGIGKTTLAKVLASSVNAEVLFLNCASGDGKVDAIQTKLIPFTQSMSLDNRPMFVILDELDSASATSDSSFQKSLRNVIESTGGKTCVFICTANYSNKIIPAVLSRCPNIKLQFSGKELLDRIRMILNQENITYQQDDLKKFVSTVIKSHYPDIRTILNLLQSCCSSNIFDISAINKFSTDTTSNDLSDPNNILLKSLVEKILQFRAGKIKLLDIRKYYLQEIKNKISDYQITAINLFNYMLDNNYLDNNKNVVIKSADIIYQMNQVVDKEISFFQLITVLSSNI